jgi:hypothetical protein
LKKHTLSAAVGLALLGSTLFAPAQSLPLPDFGPNVLLFDPSMPAATIQSRLDSLFKKQESNQFGPERYAYLFKPGHYNLDVNVGFYTQVLGLGQTPDAVTITGAVHSEANWLGDGNATCNFWRSCENLAVAPTGSAPLHWAVSQGTALRRVHIKGNLNLWDRGWSSGGFMANSQVDGQVNSGSQQQWFSRNDDWGSWVGQNWNMAFVGVTNPPPGEWPKPAYTVVAQTPLIREKPYLFIDEKGHYAVRVPALHTQGTVGISWATARQSVGVSVPLDKFYLAHADKDTAATINAALRSGRYLLLTPGIYHLESSLLVTHPETIVLGLGYPTLIPDKGTPALTVSDVGGVTVGGIIFDAGPTESPALLQVGPSGNAPIGGRKDHATNPTFLYDIVARVGGETTGTASCCVRIGSSHVVGDNLWLWRADHGAGADWNENKCRNGLIVDGSDVTLYGLFAEHFQEYQTLWNGEGGRVYFYQSELPYDAPSQSEWQHEGVDGFASYKVADGITRHEAWGLGVYGVFNHSAVKCFNAVETPAHSDVKLHHIISVWITGKSGSEITHVLNGTGEAVNTAHRKATAN